MKRTFLYSLILLMLPVSLTAQHIIENFELSYFIQASNGTISEDSMAIIVNPLPDLENNSNKVFKFIKSKDADISAGFSVNLPQEIKLQQDVYAISLQILTPKASVIKLALYDNLGNGPYEHTAENTKTGEWETLQFSISFGGGTASSIIVMPDYNDTSLTEDLTIYIDNIIIWGIHGPMEDTEFLNPIVLEDFEFTALNQLSNGSLTNDSLKIAANPAPDEVNESTNVLKFQRSAEGAPWAGFWAELPRPIDMTENKYVTVKVWRPRISGIKFKVEGGTTDPATFELAALNAPTKTEEWEVFVFHFPDATGTYPRIALLPDFNDPVDLTEDIVLYIDDIVFHPTNPLEQTAVKDPVKIDYTIYPNPVKKTLFLDNLKGAESLSIFNTAGQQVIYRKDLKLSAARVDVSALSSGIYMISVYDNEGNATIKKFLKE